MHETPNDWMNERKHSRLSPKKLRSILFRIYPEELAEDIFERIINSDGEVTEDDSD